MSRIVIYSRKQFRPTARPLADSLEAEYHEEFPPEPHNINVLFRYGNSNELRGRAEDNGERNIENNCLVINFARAIISSSDKLQARNIMMVHGVCVPRTYDLFNYKTIPNFPVIARPFHHFKGRRFFVVASEDELKPFLDGQHYFSDVINKDEEYRVFVFRNKIMEIDHKIPRVDKPNLLIRNHKNGWRFQRRPMTQVNRNVISTAISAVSSLGLTFGAVDVGLVTQQERAYAFEVNSAPGLIERKVELLVRKVREYISGD